MVSKPLGAVFLFFVLVLGGLLCTKVLDVTDETVDLVNSNFTDEYEAARDTAELGLIITYFMVPLVGLLGTVACLRWFGVW